MQARGNNVIVRQEGSGEKTYGDLGIVVSTGTKDDSVIGTVVSVGWGRYLDNGGLVEIDLAEGDRVVFSSAQRANIDGEDLLIVNAEDVLVKL